MKNKIWLTPGIMLCVYTATYILFAKNNVRDCYKLVISSILTYITTNDISFRVCAAHARTPLSSHDDDGNEDVTSLPLNYLYNVAELSRS